MDLSARLQFTAASTMLEARYSRHLLFLLVFLVSLGGWLVPNADASSSSQSSSAKLPPLPSHLAQTRRAFVSGIPISYKLDTWSQYDNPEEGGRQEGDIREQQWRKTMTTNRRLLWPDGVVKYYIDWSLAREPEKLAILMDAMNIIMSQSCVKFERIYPDENGQLPIHGWVNITGNQNGCYSDLGRNPFGPSVLNLNVDRCFHIIGHAIHEMLHTLGVYHEHMRPDRDEHITIVWENIKPGDAFNFYILNSSAVTNYGLPYDYNSIMHYSMTAFSKDKSVPTIVPAMSQVEIGQRNQLSYYDVQKLLITYNCTDVKKPNAKGDKEKYIFLRKRKSEVQEAQYPEMSKEQNLYKVEEKKDIVIGINNPMTRRLQDVNEDLQKSSGNNQITLLNKHMYIPLNYPVSLIYSLYPHIHFHLNILKQSNNKIKDYE